MSYYLTVEEYACLKGITDSAVRKQIRSRKISAVLDKKTNKKKYLIAVSEIEYKTLKKQTLTKSVPEPKQNSNPEPEPEPVLENIEDAELVSELGQELEYNLVSMEKESFDNMINSFKKLAEDKSHTDEKTIERLNEEIYRTKAELKIKEEEIKKITEELFSEKIKSAQTESDLKIKDLQIKELKEDLENKDLQIKELNEKLYNAENKPFWKWKVL